MVGTEYLVVLVGADGHMRCQISITTELLKVISNFQVSFAVIDAQHRRFKIGLENLVDRADAVAGITEDSVSWRHDAKSDTKANLNGWESESKSNESLVNSNFMMSDNLVGVLETRLDTVLSWSFLWHEVISAHAIGNEARRKFVEREVHVLRTYTPKMVCNADLATPAVLSLTNPVLVPWRVKEILESQLATQVLQDGSHLAAILVHSGGVRTLDDSARAIAQLLQTHGDLVDTDLEDDSMCFDHQDMTWQKLGVVIYHPGVGTATECVKRGIPIDLIHDQTNVEAELVAAKLKRLEFAHEHEFAKNDLKFPSLAADLLRSEKRVSLLEPFASLKTTGVHDSVNFLTKLWELEIIPQ